MISNHEISGVIPTVIPLFSIWLVSPPCYLRFSESVLTDKDCENVYELVYSSHRGVAQAAGEFLNAKLFSRELDEATRNLKSRKGKKRSENTPLIRDLVQFFIESEVTIRWLNNERFTFPWERKI